LRANELRIGNWVNDRASQPFQVSAENIARVASSEIEGKINIDFNDAPLTEEWLAKFGFTVNKFPHQLQNLFFALTGEEM